jgi:hypothetical protein
LESAECDRDLRIADDILAIFAKIGLDEPAPVPLMLVEHQLAQKLHACTWVNPKTNRNDRAHDLVDLQILEGRGRLGERTGRTRRIVIESAAGVFYWLPARTRPRILDEWAGEPRMETSRPAARASATRLRSARAPVRSMRPRPSSRSAICFASG